MLIASRFYSVLVILLPLCFRPFQICIRFSDVRRQHTFNNAQQQHKLFGELPICGIAFDKEETNITTDCACIHACYLCGRMFECQFKWMQASKRANKTVNIVWQWKTLIQNDDARDITHLNRYSTGGTWYFFFTQILFTNIIQIHECMCIWL